MCDSDEVNELGFRRSVDALYLWGLQRAAKEHAEFEKAPLWTHEEVAGFPREHDRFMGSVNPLVTERSSGLAQTIPCVPKILIEIPSKMGVRRGPAVVFFTFLVPQLDVVTISTLHC